MVGGIIVDAAGRGGQGGVDAGGETVEQAGDGGGIGGADVAVAGNAGEGGHGGEEVGGIVGKRAGGIEPLEEDFDGGGEAGEQGEVEARGDRGEADVVGGGAGEFGGGGGFDGVAEGGGVDDGDGEFGFPLERPVLLEGAFGAGVLFAAPRDFQGEQAVEEDAAGAAAAVAEVDFERGDGGGGLEAEAALGGVDVLLQWQGGQACGEFADFAADEQLRLEEIERQRVALAEDGLDGLEGFVEAGARAAAHAGEGVGETQRLDDGRGRGFLALAAQDAGGACEPGGDGIVGMIPEVAIPAGRADAGTVTAGEGEALVSPRHPGGGDLVFWQVFEQGVVGAGFGWGVEGWGVPGTADDGDVGEVVLFGEAHRFAHPGFAEQGLARFGQSEFVAQGGDGFEDGLEESAMVAALLDAVVPPAFAVAVAVGLGKPFEGVRARRGFVLLVAQGDHVGGGKVETADGDLVRERPADGVPLGGKAGERIEGCLFRQVRAVEEQGDGWLHGLFCGVGEQGFGLGRHFQQDDVRLEVAECGEQAAGTAGAVVTNAEDGGHGVG